MNKFVNMNKFVKLNGEWGNKDIRTVRSNGLRVRLELIEDTESGEDIELTWIDIFKLAQAVGIKVKL